MLKYEKIAQELRNKIISGEYSPNERLPYEWEMCNKYKVSRITIKKAVDLLVMEGLIVKRRGSGTFVKDMRDRDAIEIAMKQQISGFTATHPKGQVKSKIIEFKIMYPSKIVSDKLKIMEEDFVYYIVRIRYANDEPCVHEVTYMPIKIIPGIKREILEASIYNYIEKKLKLKVQSSHNTIRADLPTEDEQRYLEINGNFPILEVEQVAFLNNGQIFEYSISRHRSDKLKLKTINIK